MYKVGSQWITSAASRTVSQVDQHIGGAFSQTANDLWLHTLIFTSKLKLVPN